MIFIIYINKNIFYKKKYYINVIIIFNIFYKNFCKY